MIMKRRLFFVLLGLMFCSAVAGAQEVYRWVDDKGTVHLTDDPSLIPEKYWDQTQKQKMPAEPASPPPGPRSSGPPPVVQRGAPPAGKPAAGRETDVLGRGPEWWRAQAQAARAKLEEAQKNYAAAEAAVKAKEKEIRESVFKSHSQKKKLDLELRELQDKANDLAKPLEEARTVVEKTLPKQAEEYLADPNWLKAP
jgi:hypothetical protein